MKRRTFALLAVAVVVLVLAGFGASGFMRMSRVKAEIQALERDMATLRAHSEALAKTIECLRSDPLCIEKSAREDLGMAREGEIILKFPSERAR
ncbi:MAG: septum formation initiator family protein [Candidatus Rokuibacteriota bacterium]